MHSRPRHLRRRQRLWLAPCTAGLLIAICGPHIAQASSCVDRCKSRGVSDATCREICTPDQAPARETKAPPPSSPTVLPDGVATPDHALPAVSVEGARTANGVRRASVAGRIVIDRLAIDASGSSTVEQVLRKDPAITIAADGRLGLLGLPGYTTFLVDGSPPTNAKGILDLDVSQVERIEIIKSATAETGAFGIAGTINVVTRRVAVQAEQQLRLNLGGGPLDDSYRAAWSMNRPVGADHFGYSAALSASRRRQHESRHEVHARGRSPAPQALWAGEGASETVKEHLNASSTLRWQLPGRHTLEAAPSVTVLRGSSAGDVAFAALAASPPPVDANLDRGHSLLNSYSGDIKWLHDAQDGLQLEMQWLPVLMSERAQATQDVRSRSALDRYTDAYTGTTHAQTWRLRADGALGAGHDLKAGLETSLWDSERALQSMVNGQPNLSLSAFGVLQGEHSRRFSGFLEYDGQVSKRFAVNAGLRHERQVLRLTEGPDGARSRYALFAPSLHTTYKFDAAGRRQLRASVARTFNAPFSDQLRERPTLINALAPCAPGQLCGANTADQADVAGNRRLRPEKALGFNLSLEQQWGSDSHVRVEAFSRSIRDVFITDTQLQTVSWASVPRYVSRPENRGRAEVRGLSIESSVRLHELDATWPRLLLRTGLNWARSWLSEVPGPDNRFAGQNPWSAKLGVDYAPAGAHWDVSLNASSSPSGWVRNAVNQRYFESRRNELSAEASWAQSAQVKWRWALRNLLPRDRSRVDEFSQAMELTTRHVVKRTATSLHLGLELKL